MLSVPEMARAEDDWNKIVEAARKEGRVVVYSAFVGLAAHQDLKKDFEATYGITVDILEARASEVRERIRIEQAAGRFAADISENGRTTTTLQIEQDKVFDPFGPLPSLSHLKPEFRSDDIRLPVFAIVYGILVNTGLVKGDAEPKSWLDLADPRWKGKILADDLRTLGGGGVLFFVFQEQFGRDFQEKLAKQDHEIQPRDSRQRAAARARRVSALSARKLDIGARAEGPAGQVHRAQGRPALHRL